jgi:hypothetical protein
MPVYTDLNDLAQRFEVQNQDELSKYNVYFVMNQIKRNQQKQCWNMLFADRKWEPNMGPTMQGVRLEPTPIVRQFFRPAAITGRANKDLFDQQESQERATVRWHKYESRLMYFLRNFQDFISDQIKPSMADIDDKIIWGQELFLRTTMWDRAPLLYVVGAPDPVVAAPNSGPPAYTANPKNQNFLAAQIAACDGYLTPEVVDNLYHTAKEELGMYPMDGAGAMSKMPKENDPLEGQFLMLVSGEAYGQLKWTNGFDKLRSIQNDYLFKRFMGALFGDVRVKSEYKPIRFAEDGSAPDPEIIDNDTKDPIPNPTFAKITGAPVEVGFFIGGEVASAVECGPPPREFSGGASSKKVTGMTWNGKTYLTDEIVIRDAISGLYDYNSYKEYLRAQATATHACLPKRARNILPFFFRRRRVSEVGA